MVQDNQSLIDALRKLGSTTNSIGQQSTITAGQARLQRNKLGLQDSMIEALRNAPGSARDINAIAAGQQKNKSALGTVGSLAFGNPVVKAGLGALTVLDTGRRAVISTVKELTDMTDSSNATKASFGDWFNQTKDPTFGFGKAFPMKGWGGRIVGLVGDIALDPLTYASLGTYIPEELALAGAREVATQGVEQAARVAAREGAGMTVREALGGVKHLNTAEGRLALADLARKKGANNEMVRRIASEGRTALMDAPELAQALGMRKSGIYMFGSRYRVAGTGPIADFLEKGLVKSRLGIWNTEWGQKAGLAFTRAGVDGTDTSAVRFALATGKLPADVAPEVIKTLNSKNISRAIRAAAKDEAIKLVRPIIQDEQVQGVKDSVYRLLDTSPAKWAERGIVPTEPELAAYNKIRSAFKEMYNSTEARWKAVDPNFTIGQFEDYLPHLASDEALKDAANKASSFSEQIRQYLTTNMNDPKGAFRSRDIKKGSPWFGKILTAEDIAGGAERLNELAKTAVHIVDGKSIPNPHQINYNFFETDITKILDKYTNHYGAAHEAASFMEEMIKQGAYQPGRTVAELNPEAVRAADEAYKASMRSYSQDVTKSAQVGKNIASSLSGIAENLIRPEATTVAPRGALQLAVDDAKQALKAVLPEDVALARLEKAQSALMTQMDTLNKSWAEASNALLDETTAMMGLQVTHDNLVYSHQRVLDEINKLIEQKGNLGTTLEQLNEKIGPLTKELEQLDKQITNHNNAFDAAVRLQGEINDILDGTYSVIDNLTGEEMKFPPFTGNETTDDIIRHFKNNPLGAGQKGVAKPFSKDAVKEALASETAKNFLNAIDPPRFNAKGGQIRTGRISMSRLQSMKMEDVVRIISNGHTSAAALEDLRHAGAWLFMRDLAISGGELPAHVYSQFENMKNLMELAYNAQELLRGGVRSAEEIAVGKLDGAALTTAMETLKEAQRVDDLAVAHIEHLDDLVQNAIDNGISPNENGLAQRVFDAEAALKESQASRKQAEKAYNDILSGATQGVQDAATTLATPNGYRQLSSDLANALTEYRISSQVNIQFKEIADRAKIIHSIPSEQMYNKLVANIVQHDIEGATAHVAKLDRANEVLNNIKKTVLSDTQDKSLAFRRELTDLFTNPARTDEANVVRELFPEIEAAVANKKGKFKFERAYWQDPQAPVVAGDLKQLRQELGIPRTEMQDTGRRSVRNARTTKMTGLESADLMVDVPNPDMAMFEDSAGAMRIQGGVKQNANDLAYKQLKEDIRVIDAHFASEKAKVVAEQGKPGQRRGTALYEALEGRKAELNAQQEKFDSILKQHGTVEQRVKQTRQWSEEATKKLTGQGKRASEKTLTTVGKDLGQKYGFYGDIEAALNGSKPALDKFLADFLGGNKFDARFGYTTVQREGRTGMQLGQRPNMIDQYTNRYLDEAGNIVVSKSSKPSILVMPEDSVMGKMQAQARDRATRLRVLASDSDFIPTSELINGQPAEWIQAIDPLTGKMSRTYKPGVWVMQDGLHGPEGYASALEVYANELDDKIARATALEKETAQLEKQKASTTVKTVDKNGNVSTKRVSEPTVRQAESLLAEKKVAAAARKKLALLKSQPIHVSAVEMDELNQFIKQFSRLTEDDAIAMQWKINASEVGFNATDPEYVSAVTTRHEAAVRNAEALKQRVSALQEEIGKLKSRSQLGAPEAKRLNELQWQLNDIYKFEVPRNQKVLEDAAGKMNLAKTGYLPSGTYGVQSIRGTELGAQPLHDFAFTREEWRSLWNKPMADSERRSVAQMRNALNSDLNKLVNDRMGLFREGSNSSREQLLINEERIRELTAHIAELDSRIETDAVRYNAVLKMQAVRNKFDDPQWLALHGLEDRHGAINAELGSLMSKGSSATEEDMLRIQRLMGKLQDTPQTDELVRRVRNFTKGKGSATDSMGRSRRDLLDAIFMQTDEGKHIQAVGAETENAKTQLLDIRNKNLSDLKNQREQLQNKIDEISKTKEDLQIGQTIEHMDNLSKTIGKEYKKPITKVSKKATPQEALAAGRQAVEDTRQITQDLKASPYVQIDQKAFDAAKAANDVELQNIILQRRQKAKELLSFDRKALTAKTAMNDATDAMKSLFEMSDAQLKEIGLPTKKEFKQRVDLLKQLADRQQALEEFIPKDLAKQQRAVGKAAGREAAAKTRLETNYKRLSDVLESAKTQFDSSQQFRKPLEEALSDARKNVASIREFKTRAYRLSQAGKTRMKDPAYIAEIDALLSEADQLMPYIEGTNLEKSLKHVLTQYIDQKALMAQSHLTMSTAQQEASLMRGLKMMAGTSKELGNAGEVKKLLAEAGLPMNAVQMKTVFDEGFVQLSTFHPTIGVKQEIADIVQNVHRIQDPAMAQALSKFMGPYTQFFKGYATLSPGFHVRNALSNGFQLFAAGAHPERLQEGLKWSSAWREASANGDSFFKWIETVPEAKRKLVRDAWMAAASSGSGMTADALEKGVLPFTKNSRKLGDFIEQHSRFMLSYDGALAGLDFNSNVARTRRFLIDYADTSSADKVMKQIVPFWMWTSRNFPMHVQNMWSNPRPYAIYNSIKRNLSADEGDTMVPTWVKEMGAFKLPFGTDLYAAPDLGFNRINQQINEFQDPARMLSNVNPLLRLPMELAGNRQFYSNRPFSTTPTPIGGGVGGNIVQPILQAAGYGQTGPTGQKFVDDKAYYAIRNLIPFLSTAERLSPSTPTYSNRGNMNALMGFAGIPLKQITPDMQASEAYSRQKQLQELIKKQNVIQGK